MEPPHGYPNAWVEIVIRTHLPGRGQAGDDLFSRNHINVLSSDVIVALPGGPGTASEARLAMHYGRPIIAFLKDVNEIPALPAEIPVKSTLSDVQAFINNRLEKLDEQ